MKNTITVLVVDDEMMIRSLIERILSRDGYSVLLAEDGNRALDTLRTEKVDIVVSDMKMPGMDGFKLLQAIKREFPRIDVIMMTAYGDTYTVKDALLLGADEYVSKPFKTCEISLVVERAYWRILSKARQALPQVE